MKVAIIVGHEANKQGAVNVKTGVTEFAFNTRLAELIQDEFDLMPGFECIVVYRENGYEELPYDVNRTGADIAISLHCNAFNKKARGCETLHWYGSKNGALLAECLHDSFVNVYGVSSDRGVKPRTASDRGANLLRKTSMPCVIVEPFFIDNDAELEYALDNINKLAKAVVYGVADYQEV